MLHRKQVISSLDPAPCRGPGHQTISLWRALHAHLPFVQGQPAGGEHRLAVHGDQARDLSGCRLQSSHRHSIPAPPGLLQQIRIGRRRHYAFASGCRQELRGPLTGGCPVMGGNGILHVSADGGGSGAEKRRRRQGLQHSRTLGQLPEEPHRCLLPMPAKELARQPRLAQQGFHRPVGALMGGAEHEDARTLPCGEISPEFLVCGCQSTDQQTAGTVG